ncbi:acyloxyacyl hydrolase [Tenacibaculum mesophilum]|uniref:acyloxyacyl hydrolase n=1 Tax=Tenacibaculum mesophilum TaxID=104268 RepID=UPI0024905BA1|nr:acyloxyacyl hydrolase [Tenacibaculum mesophilum]
MYKRIKVIAILFLLINIPLKTYSQSNQNDWPHIPGLTPEIITKKGAFYTVMGAATLSYVLSEFVFKGDENLNYYQVRGGMNNEHFWALRNVYHQNFGVEKRVSSWFAIAAEFNLQQWSDRTPNINSKNKFGLGAGIMTYYRWYALGKKRISPYFEYGVGGFLGFEKFPYNGSSFTFNHSTQLGIEYTFKNKNKLRLGYGHFHQSNNDLSKHNPGYNANGFSVAFSWFWKTSKW